MHPFARSKCRPKAKQRFTVNERRYVLGGKIADGAAGLVRKALRRDDEATVGVKFLAPDPKWIEESSFDDVAARFRREGERGTALIHPNLLKIHAYCANEGGAAFDAEKPKNPFLLMEFVRGTTLESYVHDRSKVVREKVFSVDEHRLAIALGVVEALQYLHTKRLIHRDVKPSNIFLSTKQAYVTPGTVKLGDFGIMKWGDFRASVTTGTLTATHQRGLGTLKYMSPEQAVRPRDVTTKSDIYSLGITLFELFADRSLPSPHHVFELMAARLQRGTTLGRFTQLGYTLVPPSEDVAEVVLDCFRRGISGRPKIRDVWGRLAFAYERVTGVDWVSAINR